MHILSLDIGIKNLGVSYFKQGLLQYFDLINISTSLDPSTSISTSSSASTNLERKVIDYLDNLDFINSISTVLIEQQKEYGKGVNLKCIKVAQTIKVFFYLAAPEVVVISVKANFKGYQHNLTYKKRKEWAINEAEKYITTTLSLEMQERFAKLKKKDDVADSIMQGLWYLGVYM